MTRQGRAITSEKQGGSPLAIRGRHANGADARGVAATFSVLVRSNVKLLVANATLPPARASVKIAERRFVAD